MRKLEPEGCATLPGSGLEELQPRLEHRPKFRLTRQMPIEVKFLGLPWFPMDEAVAQEVIENLALEILPDAPKGEGREEIWRMKPRCPTCTRGRKGGVR